MRGFGEQVLHYFDRPSAGRPAGPVDGTAAWRGESIGDGWHEWLEPIQADEIREVVEGVARVERSRRETPRSRLRGRSLVGIAAVLVSLALGCSAGDPPNPDAARTTTTAPAGEGRPASEDEADQPEGDGPADVGEEQPEEEELPEADDATLDALEDQFEDRGVKDIRGEPGTGVTILLEDELTIDDARPACATVRAAGFPDVNVEIDDVSAPCP